MRASAQGVAACRIGAVVVACALFFGAAPVARAQDVVETTDPEYDVYLPSEFETLNPWVDRFEVAVRRKTPTDAVRALHLLIDMSRDEVAIIHREETRPLVDGSRAEFHWESLLSFWPIARNARFVQLLPEFLFDGIAVRIEVREDGPQGRVIYASRDPNRTIAVSIPGVFESYGWGLTLLGLLLGLALAIRNVRRAPDPASRRGVLAFDLGALALVPLLPVVFGRYGVVLAVPFAAVATCAGQRFKEQWVTTLRKGGFDWRQPLLLSPALMASALAVIWILWHETLIWTFQFSPADFREVLLPLTLLYLLAAVLVSSLVHRAAVRVLSRGGRARLLFSVLIGTVLVGGLLRRLDWAVFYQTSDHADEELWYHAFYRQNLSLVTSDWGAWVLGTLAVEVGLVILLLLLARRFAARALEIDRREFGANAASHAAPWLRSLLLANGLIAFLGVALAHSAALTWIHPSTRDISGSVWAAFGAVPEYKVLEPLVRSLFRGPPPPLERPDPAFAARAEQAMGLRLESCSPEYPLVRPSIYLDPSHRVPDLPRVPPGTNVIVVVVESLSSRLLADDVQGISGLTNNFRDFASRSLSFTRLWSSEFPTLRGEISDFSSFLFARGGAVTASDVTRVVRARFLFLSDVLKTRRGYHTMHVQSDYGTFAGTAGVFLRHHYDRVLTAEDPELLAHATHGLEKTWGLYDEDLFAAVVDLLAKGELPQPFFLSVATTDTHFPYGTLRHHPASGGNSLLDSIYSADAAFGVFWDWFRKSPYADNTMLVVVADHALAPRTLQHIRGSRHRHLFDWVAGMIRLPGEAPWRGVKDDRLAAQADLAPTLLDLLDLDVENPFVGLSIFSGREHFPVVPTGELPVERLTDGERDAIAATGWSGDDQVRLVELLTRLALADRIRPEGSACGDRPAGATDPTKSP